jgi:FkbM family methyltransferase
MKSILLMTVGALNKVVSPKDINSVSKYMYIRKLIEELEISIILDVGANIGQFGKSMRDLGYAGIIISFEPVTAAFSKLKTAARLDPNWKILNFALGVANETRKINVMKSSVFSSFNKPSSSETSQFTQENSVMETENVQVRRLDEVIGDLGLRGKLKNCFLKSDTQGFDRNVLNGLGSYLNEVCLLQLEMSVVPIYENTIGMLDMIRYLQDRSFTPIALFPINRLTDWSTVEFDYLGVNRATTPSL